MPPICALPGAMGEQAVADFFGAQRMRYQIVAQDNWDDLVKAYTAGSCTVLTGDISLLAQARSKLKVPDDHIILPELITKEPLGPAVRQDDAQWFAVVRWTLMALIEAEELGLTQRQRRRAARLYRSRHPPLPRARGQPRSGTGAAARLGLSGGQERRQLRRDFRTHARHEVRPEAGARAQQLVDQGWPDVLDALPLRRSSMTTFTSTEFGLLLVGAVMAALFVTLIALGVRGRRRRAHESARRRVRCRGIRQACANPADGARRRRADGRCQGSRGGRTAAAAARSLPFAGAVAARERRDVGRRGAPAQEHPRGDDGGPEGLRTPRRGWRWAILPTARVIPSPRASTGRSRARCFASCACRASTTRSKRACGATAARRTGC